MDKVVFSSCKPYLQICLSRNEDISNFITFDSDGAYSPKDEAELQSLRTYAERTKISYLIAEGADPEELRRKYEELEDTLIQEAEDRATAMLEEEKRCKEDHEFYSLLRFSDKAYR